MRVLVITPWFPTSAHPTAGIFNRRDVELLEAEHDVTVLHLGKPDEAEGERPGPRNLKILGQQFSLTRPWTLIGASKTIRRIALDFDLIHSMAFPALLPVWLARTRVAWVHTEHFSNLITPQKSIAMKLAIAVLKPLFRYPDETVAVGTALARVIDKYRVRQSTVIANEVVGPVDSTIVQRNVSQSIRLIGVGGMVARKGPIEAVETLAELTRRGIDCTLTWVGEGELSAEMRSVASRLGVRERLRQTGQLLPEDLSNELLSADLFLLPVESETFGVAIAEALAHGLPVVATGSGGHEEFLPPEASRLISERAAGPLADAIESIRADARLWTRTEIAQFARERFSSSSRRKAYADVYSQAIISGQDRRMQV